MPHDSMTIPVYTNFRCWVFSLETRRKCPRLIGRIQRVNFDAKNLVGPGLWEMPVPKFVQDDHPCKRCRIYMEVSYGRKEYGSLWNLPGSSKRRECCG